MFNLWGNNLDVNREGQNREDGRSYFSGAPPLRFTNLVAATHHSALPRRFTSICSATTNSFQAAPVMPANPGDVRRVPNKLWQRRPFPCRCNSPVQLCSSKLGEFTAVSQQPSHRLGAIQRQLLPRRSPTAQPIDSS